MNNLIFIHKVKTKTSLVKFFLKFQKPAHPYPINFLKLNHIKPSSQLRRSKHRIFAGGPALWNEFLIDSEKETKKFITF